MLLQTMLKNLITIIDSSVIKYSKYAQDNETAQSKRVADHYASALDGSSGFYSYERFSVDAIIKSGLPVFRYTTPARGEYSATTYASEKNLIPEEYRDRVVEEQRKIIINRYETYGDQNNYYRMLSGLPDLEDTDYIKPDESVYTQYNIPTDTYIHQFSDDIIRSLRNNGVIDQLISDNPTKKYLRFLGNKRINPLKARRANNFALLYIESDDIPSSFYDRFVKIYEQNREYISTALYNSTMSDMYELYDNFTALCVMFMTIQRFISSSFQQGISRDLFDWEFIQKLYSAYNIPFIETLPMDTHITLMKNFNYLLKHKSTDKVLFDLCSLLGYSNVELEKYYLVRNHKTDANGNLIFLTKEDGTPDYENMFDLYFKTIPLSEKNVAIALQDTTATKSYEEVTEADPYWWDSGDLKNTILEDHFNYYETKYISINLMYNMSDIMFELTYTMRSILDQKDNIDKYEIEIDLPRINNNRSFSLFNIAVFVIAGLCKMNNLKGNILNKASSISHIYGYRHNAFKSDLVDKALYDLTFGEHGAETGSPSKPYSSGASSAMDDWMNRNYADRRKYNTDDISYTDTETSNSVSYDGIVSSSWSTISSADEFNRLFDDLKHFEENIVSAMWNTNDINVYNAYRSIYDIYMTKTAVDTMFTRSDGTIAPTYLEYLKDADSDLYNVINDTHKDSLYDILNHAIGRLQEVMDNLDNLNQLIDDGNTAYSALMSLINFFKSYTVDIHSFNIWYVFDSKYYNAMRLFTKIGHIDSWLWVRDTLNMLYNDCITPEADKYCSDSLSMRDDISFKWDE